MWRLKRFEMQRNLKGLSHYKSYQMRLSSNYHQRPLSVNFQMQDCVLLQIVQLFWFDLKMFTDFFLFHTKNTVEHCGSWIVWIWNLVSFWVLGGTWVEVTQQFWRTLFNWVIFAFSHVHRFVFTLYDILFIFLEMFYFNF